MNISINKLNHFPDTRYTAQHSVDSKYSVGTFNISTHHSHQHTSECQVEELFNPGSGELLTTSSLTGHNLDTRLHCAVFIIVCALIDFNMLVSDLAAVNWLWPFKVQDQIYGRSNFSQNLNGHKSGPGP